MELLRFLFYIGIVFIVLSLIWGLFMLLLNLLTAGERKGIFEEHLLKAANYYLLANLTAIATTAQVKAHSITHYGYEIAGLIMLYLYLIGKMERQRFAVQIQRGFNRMNFQQSQQDRRIDLIYLVATLALFLVCLAEPSITDNPVNEWFYTSIVDIYDTPVIGWVIKIFGAIFLLVIIMRGVQQTQKLVNSLNGATTGPQDRTKDKDDFDDYEIVE